MAMDGNKPEFPLRQMQLLMACRLVEPLAVNSIVTYLLPMVKHVSSPDVSDSEATRRVTLLFSAYSLAQFGTNIIWGRLSDRIGRRPVMLFGLAGVFVSTLGFAFSTSVAAMLTFRIAAGLLSGNVVITRTMIGDMVHGRENTSRAFAWNQTAYQIGTVVGPFIGGYLAQPCTQLPGLCKGGRFAFLQAYPFALPNLVIAVLLAISWTVAYFCVGETLVQDKMKDTTEGSDEISPLLEHHRRNSSFTHAAVTSTADEATAVEAQSATIFTADVFHVILCYALMALHTGCYDQIMPAFLASTTNDGHMSPLHPLGGLGYSSSTVGSFVSAAGLFSIFLMISLFPPVDNYVGSLRCMRASLVVYPLVYLAVPYLVMVPQTPAWIRLGCVGTLFGLKTAAAVFSFNDNSILLNAAVPSLSVLGLVNGVAQTAANGARAMGPAVMGIFIGMGDKAGTNALGWWFLVAVGMVGVVQVFWVADEKEDE